MCNSPASRELFNELSYYTLAQPRSSFIHQVAIDTFTAQTADATTKPIAVVFALAGLYLHLEKGLSGLQVQAVHMRLANRPKQWPVLPLPRDRGSITVSDVLKAPAGPERDAMIERWSASVWQEWQESRNTIADLLSRELDIR
ncbi:MAG TPA: DUF5946 family protein [Acidobacteriaceae bacterium]|nr:DUF5946 family protein [Acidobacteriaceae bacterium]